MTERGLSQPITACLACGSSSLARYLDLGRQPHANAYHKGGCALPEYPLEVDFCRECAHSQLSVVVDPGSMFRHYLYVSGTSTTHHRHFNAMAEEAVAMLRPSPGACLRVLDLACNDGTALDYFRKRGCDVVGVDPAENLRPITREKGIPVVTDFWGDEAAARVLEQGGPVDLITAANVLAHVGDPLGFLTACHRVLKPGGRVMVQSAYGTEMVTRGEFDQVYHEHVSYFLASSFRRLAERAGFRVAEVAEAAMHGGSIRFYLEAQRADEEHSPELERFLEVERRRGLHELETYRAFAREVARKREAFPALVERCRADGLRVVGYGASAKGNTMLNHFEVSLDYLVDDNPLKWEHMTPGRDVPIVSPEVLRTEEAPLAIVLTAWNFEEEIRQKILRLRGEKPEDCFLLYVPTVLQRSLGTLTPAR